MSSRGEPEGPLRRLEDWEGFVQSRYPSPGWEAPGGLPQLRQPGARHRPRPLPPQPPPPGLRLRAREGAAVPAPRPAADDRAGGPGPPGHAGGRQRPGHLPVPARAPAAGRRGHPRRRPRGLVRPRRPDPRPGQGPVPVRPGPRTPRGERPLAGCGPPELWRGRLQLTLSELAQVKALLEQREKKLGEMAKADAAVRLLEAIPGVGPRTAEDVVAFLPQPEQFRTSKQVSADGGLVPRQYQSTNTGHRGRITKRGPRALRKLLVECAWVTLRYNAWARAVYQRLTHGLAPFDSGEG